MYRHPEGTLLTNEVRNEQGVWINSQTFREEALSFMRNKYYCPHPKGTPSWREYWDEQLNRCNVGYSSGGVKITGHHYFYLNFTQINVAKQISDKIAKKRMVMPDFWDGDYNFFWAVEIARNGLFSGETQVPSTPEERVEYNSIMVTEERRRALEDIVLARLNLQFKIKYEWRDGAHHVIIGKARRKGYSYKNAALCVNIYNTQRDSLTIIGAFDKKYLYPRGTMGMASSYLSFLNKHTAWGKGREFVDKQEHRKASFKKMIEGKPVEAGYMSEIMAITFKDNPDAARGKDAQIVLLEEAGKFPNLKDSFRATVPGLTAGKFITGQIIIFGTGGDMESGTVDFADMFYHPEQDNLMPFVNIWDDHATNSFCSFFHPATWNMEGYYDEQGNSDIDGALAEELGTREKMRKDATSSDAIQHRVQEFPLNPSEAFLTVSHNDFPVIELQRQLNKVKRENLHLKYGQPCHLFYEKLNEDDRYDGEGNFIKGRKYEVKAVPDLDNKINPLWSYKPTTQDYRSGVVIYEYPISNPPKGLYKIGFDPYRQVKSGEAVPSMGAIYVYKGNNKFTYTRDRIVAQYVGRPYSPDEVNRIAELLALLYNAEIMHENEVTHVRGYFERKKRLHLLAAQPDTVISKNVKASKVARVYGIHMSEKLKDAGEKYIKEWLLEVRDYDENGDAITNLETIYDPALLEELILYNRKGNFDRVMAFMMLMFQLQEEDEGKEYTPGDPQKANAEQFNNMMKKQFNKRKGGRSSIQ